MSRADKLEDPRSYVNGATVRQAIFLGIIHMKIEAIRQSAISSDDFREIVGYESGVQGE